MKSATAISANYLQRLADPASRLHSDYLEYKKRQISRAELVARLPHVALIGDSVSRDVYVSSRLSTFWRARMRRGQDWFLNTQPSPTSVYSVFERLEKLAPVVAIQYGGVGALVDKEPDRQNLFRRVLGTRNFSGQVTEVLARKRFPDLILVWIGHNNADWTWWSSPAEFERPENSLQRQSARVRQDYERQVRCLVARAKTERHRVAIVIYGLVNFASFFHARETAESLRDKNPKLYPYLEVCYEYFTSLRPAYRHNVARLAVMINEQLRAMTAELERELKPFPNVQIRYSDALAQADLSRVEVIHAMDGWHPSAQGHTVLAEAAFNGLAPSLEFLGIAQPSINEHLAHASH